eukprot:TRINITY_DN8392_c0_g1_i2.p1 TRINITY_DN8392_c0_g1~~TRINITY_DN8392_c0_g1_i2.p1  ORF type:complete len:568 (-),score=45.67 TRINITY_DN8392_c0_g1_i2:69-1772(-)
MISILYFPSLLALQFLIADAGRMFGAGPSSQGSNPPARIPKIPGHDTKAIFAVARHGTKAWMGGTDFLDPENKYFSPGNIDLLKKAGIPWISSTVNKTDEGAAIGELFGAPGGPSTLTATGMNCEKKVGEFYRQTFFSDNSFGSPYVYSDDDQRDFKSGELFLAGWGVANDSAGRVDQSMIRMLAEMSDKKLIQGCPCATPNEIMTEPKQSEGWEVSPLHGFSTNQISTYGKDFFATELEYVSKLTGTREPFESRKETWMANVNEPLKTWRTLDGGLRSACMVVQVWEAEIASNVDVEKTLYHNLGVDPKMVPRLMKICAGLWAINMSPVNRGRNVELAIQLLSSMQQAVSGKKSTLDAVHHPPQDNVVMYMAHNFNVDVWRQILGVQWSLNESGWGCQDSASCVSNADPFHVRLNMEIVKKTSGESHFVRISVFQVMLPQTKASCTGDHALNVEENLHFLDMPKTLCPSFDPSTKLCPWEEFESLLISFIWSTQQKDGFFCAEQSSAAWFEEKYPKQPLSSAKDTKDALPQEPSPSDALHSLASQSNNLLSFALLTCLHLLRSPLL